MVNATHSFPDGTFRIMQYGGCCVVCMSGCSERRGARLAVDLGTLCGRLRLCARRRSTSLPGPRRGGGAGAGVAVGVGGDVGDKLLGGEGEQSGPVDALYEVGAR